MKREELPYRVGDRVILCGELVTIEDIDGIFYKVKIAEGRYWHCVEPFLRKYGKPVPEEQKEAA